MWLLRSQVVDYELIMFHCLPVARTLLLRQLPVRLQLFTGLLEWLLYSIAIVNAAPQLQEAAPRRLQLAGLVAWSFLVLFVVPTWAVALHTRGLQKRYQLLMRQWQRPNKQTAASCATSSHGQALKGGPGGQSSRQRRRAAALRRCASAPGSLGTCDLGNTNMRDTMADTAGCSSQVLSAAHTAARPSTPPAASPPPSAAAAAHQFLHLLAAAQPLVFLDDASSSAGPLGHADARVSKSAPSLMSPVAGSSTSGASSSGTGSWAVNSSAGAPGVPATAMPPTVTAAAGAALDVHGPIVEEPPETDVDIAAVRDRLRPRLVALLGSEVGERLMASFSSDARPGDAPLYDSISNLVPISVKVSGSFPGRRVLCCCKGLLQCLHPACHLAAYTAPGKLRCWW